MMKKVFLGLLCMMMLVGCQKEVKPEETPTPTEETVLNDQERFVQEYPELEVGHVFYYGTKDTVIPFLEHGTGVIYIGFPECPWCQAYVPYLDDVAKQNNLQVMYYNIYTDKTEDPGFYKQVAEIINEKDESIIQYDNDGNMRIYMPLVLFLKGGELVGYDNETCMEDSDKIKPVDYWTNDKVDALKTKLSSLCAETKKAQEENDNQGCDNGCEVDVPTDVDTSVFEALLLDAHQNIHPGVAGSSIQISLTSAKMMEWYMTQKPSQDIITSTMQAFVQDKQEDKGSLSFVFESLQGASEFALSDDGEAQLRDNGFTGEINWTEEDIQNMFIPILEVIDAMPE